MNDHFGVAVGSEDMPEANQLGAKLLEVVDLSIEDDPDGGFRIGHRLMSEGEIDDRQTSKAEPERALNQVALIVRAAMDDRRGHPADGLRVDRLVDVLEVKLTGNAAHGQDSIR